MHIIFGDCVALGGIASYALLFIDISTCYCWIHHMSSLTSSKISNTFELFQANTILPKRFNADFEN